MIITNARDISVDSNVDWAHPLRAWFYQRRKNGTIRNQTAVDLHRPAALCLAIKILEAYDHPLLKLRTTVEQDDIRGDHAVILKELEKLEEALRSADPRKNHHGWPRLRRITTPIATLSPDSLNGGKS